MQTVEIAPCVMTRVVNCPWSHKYDEVKDFDPEIDYDNKPVYGTDMIAKGIVAHRYAAALINNDDDKLIEIATYPAFSDTLAENVLNYVDFCYEQLPKAEEHPHLKAEYSFEEGQLNFLYPGCYGRADLIIDSDNDLTIIDLKYGNDDVDAEGNFQLLAYAVGQEIETRGKHDNIHLIIFNAFKGTHTRWDLTSSQAHELTAWMQERLNLALNDKKPPYEAGIWCNNCPNKCKCGTWIKRITHAKMTGHPNVKKEEWPEVAKWLKDEGRDGNREIISNIVKDHIESGDIPDKVVKVTKIKKWDDDEGKTKKIMQKLSDLGYATEEFVEFNLMTPAKLRDTLGVLDPRVLELIEKEAVVQVRRTIVNVNK